MAKQYLEKKDQNKNNTNTQSQNQSHKMLYIVLGGVAVLVILTAGIWYLTKKDSITEQLVIEERKFNEQDIDDILNLNNREEWLKLYERKAKSHLSSAKKIAKEIENIPSSISSKEQIERYKEIFKSNQFIENIIIVGKLFTECSFEYSLKKECLNKYKKHLSYDPKLCAILQSILQLLPIKLKENINQNAQNNIIRLPLEIKNKIKNQVDNEDERNAYLRNIQYLVTACPEYTNKHPNTIIELINDEDATVLNLIFTKSTVYDLKRLFNIDNKTIEDISAIIGRTIENNSILKEFQQYFVIINTADYMIGEHAQKK